MTTTLEKPKPRAKLKANFYPPWSPRFWHGMRAGIWFRVMARNRFRIHPLRWGLAFTITTVTLFNTVLAALERLFYGRAVRNARVEPAPIFIIGHWRSGTTLMHELLCLDAKYSYPTTYQCFAPSHFLLSEAVLTRLLWLLLPGRRPMDNMVMGWNLPQEDEFALANLGVPSPYLRMAFPNHPPVALDYLDFGSLPASDVAAWQEQLDRFVRKLSVRAQGKQIVLKSPPHTGRMQALAELYPGAKFIHMTRDPAALFPSTVRLWRSLDEVQGLQVAKENDLEEFVYTCLERMYASFEAQRQAVGDDRVVDVRYEDLVRDPVGKLEEIYARLNLGDFSAARPKIEEYQTKQKDYKTNRHELDSVTKSEMARRWAGYYERYGYATE